MDKTQTLERVSQNSGLFPEWFLPWLDTNFDVLLEFAEVADGLWDRGVRRNSINMIREVTRFNRVMANRPVIHFTNTVTPYVGRTYVLMHPERVGLFEYVKNAAQFLAAIRKLRGA